MLLCLWSPPRGPQWDSRLYQQPPHLFPARTSSLNCRPCLHVPLGIHQPLPVWLLLCFFCIIGPVPFASFLILESDSLLFQVFFFSSLRLESCSWLLSSHSPLPTWLAFCFCLHSARDSDIQPGLRSSDLLGNLGTLVKLCRWNLIKRYHCHCLACGSYGLLSLGCSNYRNRGWIYKDKLAILTILVLLIGRRCIRC